MQKVDIIIPVKNEAKNVSILSSRIHRAMSQTKIPYSMIFIDDHSTDRTYQILLRLTKKYPLKVYEKIGKPGKAYSILEGAKYSRAKNLVMIDGDLQYPPAVIPKMIAKLAQSGVVVAKRKVYSDSLPRKFISDSFKFLFGKFLFGLKVDVQSGLKAFKKEIISHISENQVSPWTLDIPLLLTAQELGFSITEVDIEFGKRLKGNSKVNMIKSSWEIGSRALKHKLSKKKIYSIPSEQENTMIGAGVIHNKKRFITHTTLEHHESAIKTFQTWQKLLIGIILSVFVFGLFSNWLLTIQVIIAILSFIYFIDMLFSFFLVTKSLHTPPELSSSDKELSEINDSKLPIYSVLCPLYKEAKILPNFLEAISKFDWPKEKLDVQLLLEEDDKQTIEAAQNLDLQDYVRITIVPFSQPKTKPKACNYGLNKALGEYLVIYDAEDIPDPLQLKKAYLGFQTVSDKTACLQAKLNYFNPHQNILTRLFTSEYSLWFDLILSGFQSINTIIPLGGTSNHFKTMILQEIKGWDPFNVTEDCDLGARLFKKGYKTAIIDSTTLEEANSNVRNWLRQRSRWIKGYMQTFLVHNRNPLTFFKEHKWHALIFQLIIGARISFMLINPILWLTTISYFALNGIVGPTIESFYPAPVFYMAVTALIFGNFLYIYNYMIGCAKRDQWPIVKYVFLIPIYWLLASIASFIALYQLLVKPYYWEKTIHGLHLQEKAEEIAQQILPETVLETFEGEIRFSDKIRNKLKKAIGEKQIFVGGSLLILANLIANFSNFIFNAFLGRTLSIEEFGEVSLFTSIWFIFSMFTNALSGTMSHKTAYLFGKHSKSVAKGYLKIINKQILYYSLFSLILWIILIPISKVFFQSDSLLSFLLFSPVLGVGLIAANYYGYLKGTLSFGFIGVMTVTEAIVKLVLTTLLVYSGFEEFVIIAIPTALITQLFLSWYLTRKDQLLPVPQHESKFNRLFYFSSILNGISTISFLGIDIILAKHFLTPYEAGQYGLISLVGKVSYFMSALFLPFIIPIVAKNEGAKKNSKNAFIFLFGTTATLSTISFIILGVFGNISVPLLFGSKALTIINFLPIFMLAISIFTIAKPIVYFYQAKENYIFSIAGFTTTILQVILITIFHSDLKQFINMMFLVSVINIEIIIGLYAFRNYVKIASSNLNDLYSLIFSPFKVRSSKQFFPSRILILNWRDTKHKWAGGAENYVHELAKRWVKKGTQVTIFCGNDGHQPRHEVLDGIKIIRRGGFYTVYVWAFLYYILRLRGLFDVVIDSENGLPFFTPLYVKVPKFLLIHHIHQEVFRAHLPLPQALLAQFLESKIMPLVYRNQEIITVSQSSKKEILKMKLGSESNITVINPGIELVACRKIAKTENPSFVYLGRLKPYKNIDVIIKAFGEVIKGYSEAELNIAGDGESSNELQQLTKDLSLENNVKFLGKISEKEKAKLLSKSWVMLQPSMIEGWGITVIEANAAKTPVIASNVNGLRDSVVEGKTGYLVKVGDIEGFAETMIALIDNTENRERLSKEAYRWSKKFTWKKSSQEFYTLILNSTVKDPMDDPYKELAFASSTKI